VIVISLIYSVNW